MVWKYAPFGPFLPRSSPLRALRTHSYASNNNSNNNNDNNKTILKRRIMAWTKSKGFLHIHHSDNETMKLNLA